MKRFLAAVIAASMVAFNSLAYAAEAGTTVDAGITPDSIFYTVDKLFEDLQLVFASSTEEEAGLLLEFAQERLAEAKEMTVQEKTQFVETAIKDYMTTLEQAQDAVLEVVTDEDQDQEVKEELIGELEETTEVDEEIQENLDDEQQEELEEATEQVAFTANVVKNIDVETVASLREQGFGFGQIAHVVVLAEKSGKTVEEIAGLVKDDKRGIGEVARELGVQPSEMKPKSLKTAEAVPEEEAGEDTAEETPDDTTESAPEPENIEAAAVSAVPLSSQTKRGEDTKKQPAAKTEEIKKADKNAVKSEVSNPAVEAPEDKKADNTQAQAKKDEKASMQEPAGAEKTDTAEAPKQDDSKKQESKDNSSGSAESGNDEASKGGSSSSSGNGNGGGSNSSSGGNSGGNGGGSGKK